MLIVLQCTSEPEFNVIILKYEFTHGWTNKNSCINIYFDYSAVKIVNEKEEKVFFSESEKEDLLNLLSYFENYKRIYQPENGAWHDISTHELIYYNGSAIMNVGIYEPLNSENLPGELVMLVNLLLSKL